MNCARMETLLVAYLDGRARPAEQREAEAHLNTCAACRARAAEFRRLYNVLDELPQVEPSPSFDAQLRQRIAAAPRRGVWAWLTPAPRAAFAFVALLVMAIWISSLAPVETPVAQQPEVKADEFQMINDLPALEDYDVLVKFDALSEIGTHAAKSQQEM